MEDNDLDDEDAIDAHRVRLRQEQLQNGVFTQVFLYGSMAHLLSQHRENCDRATARPSSFAAILLCAFALQPCYHAVCIVVLLRCTVALSLASATPSADSSPSGGGGGGGALGDGGSSARKPAPTGLERSILKRCVCTGRLFLSCLLLFCRYQFCRL